MSRTSNLTAFAIVFILFGTCHRPALAEGYYQKDNELRLVRIVAVTIVDDVTGGCLPQPNILRTEAELILRRSGIRVVTLQSNEYLPEGGYELSIQALGGTTNGLCVVNLDLVFIRPAKMPEGHEAAVLGYMKGRLAFYTKVEMQEQLRVAVSTIVTDLANEILKVRDK